MKLKNEFKLELVLLVITVSFFIISVIYRDLVWLLIYGTMSPAMLIILYFDYKKLKEKKELKND